MFENFTMSNVASKPVSRRDGFTLLELLVVVAIIAMLAAILFPVFASVREKARQTTCLSNGKQIGLGLLQYVQDCDEITPDPCFPLSGNSNNAQTLGTLLSPYVKSVNLWRCPSDTLHVRSVDDLPGSPYGGYGNVSYAYNYYFLERSKIPLANQPNYLYYPVPLPMSSLLTPSQDGAIFADWGAVTDDTNSFAILSVNTFPSIEGFPLNSAQTAVNQTTVRGHNNGGIVTYADGHAKWQPGLFLYSQYQIEYAAAGGAYRNFGIISTLYHE